MFCILVRERGYYNSIFTLPAALNKRNKAEIHTEKRQKRKNGRPSAGLFLRRYKIVPGLKIESPTFCGVETNGLLLIGCRLEGRRSSRLIDKLID